MIILYTYKDHVEDCDYRRIFYIYIFLPSIRIIESRSSLTQSISIQTIQQSASSNSKSLERLASKNTYIYYPYDGLYMEDFIFLNCNYILSYIIHQVHTVCAYYTRKSIIGLLSSMARQETTTGVVPIYGHGEQTDRTDLT